MNKKYFTVTIFIYLGAFSFAQNVGIGTNTPKAKLEIASSNSGILIPRLTTTARNAISNPPKGLLVFDSTAKQFYYHDGKGWQTMAAASSIWQQNGAAGNEIKNTNAGGFWSAAASGLDFLSTNSTNPPAAPVSGAGTRLMWIPSRSAFRAGTIYDDGTNGGNNWDASKIGLYSFATGQNTTASGQISTAIGSFTIASGNGSIATGSGTTASGAASTATGGQTTASGVLSTAMGNSTIASGDFSTALGNYGSTNNHDGSFIIHDNINENIDGITRNSQDNQMIMKFYGGFGFYSGGGTDASMGFEKTRGLTVYGKGISTYGGGNIYTENGGKMGVNTATPNATLQVNGGVSLPIKVITSDYTVQEGDYTLLVEITSNITIKLPEFLTNNGRIINIIYQEATSQINTDKNVTVTDISGSIVFGHMGWTLGEIVNDLQTFRRYANNVSMQCTGTELYGGWISIANNDPFGDFNRIYP